MDDGQKWAIAITRETLADYGWPARPLDLDRTAVILGNAMGGEKHYQTSHHIAHAEFEAELQGTPHFAALPPAERARALAEFRERIDRRFPPVTEDTMPGELSNCIAGRIANLFNFHGANYVTDAACASALAAMSAAVDGLVAGHFDTVLTGGLDRNMGPTSFVKFCKIGALSATGYAPLRGRGRRLRHGRRRGVLPPQAPRRRRARRRPDLRRHPGHRRLERRARQGASPPRTRSASASRSGTAGRPRVSTRRPAPSSRGTARRRRSATSSRSRASSRCSARPASRSTPSRSARSSRTSAT